MAQNLFDLTGKVALVTGANSGLGLAFARGLAKAGADVVIWGRRADKNQATVATLKEYGTRVIAQEVDVSNEAEVVAAMADAAKQMGRLDCVVANAGIANMQPSTVDTSAEAYHSLLAINQHGAFYTLREAARHMVERSKAGDAGGSLIICGSMSIFGGVPGLAHYAAAKGALDSMSKSMAVELGPHQIRVNVLAPGFIATEMTQADPEIFKIMDAGVSAKTPLGRSGRPEDLEGIVVYLASDRSRYHTGDTLVIDGGAWVKI
ncbi:MAG: 2-deoxy-D-gluconate 3-dehydrogenase [Verrucomicrobiaceae bacterium]|nr:2-deoxy-D-gluconate 3-dehydrogenase [Verrucomicrobiaceae bacterium]